MKKTFIFLALMLAIGAAQASGLNDLRIYINPGHGGWEEMNDRHIPTMPFPQYMDAAQTKWDTLGFWESSNNLKVAFELRDMLLNAGVSAENIRMSRETNASGIRDIGQLTWDLHRLEASEVDSARGDRPFSVIKAEAWAMSPDLLLSIHSNAAGHIGDAANYVVAYIEGNDKCKSGSNTGKEYAADETSYNMAGVLVKWQLDPLDTYHEAADGYIWSYHNEWSLLMENEGVPAYRPTVLVEASFHSYLPNAHRFLNRDYDKQEAYRFYMAINELFGGGSCPATGVVCGDVRSKKEKAPTGSWNVKTDSYPTSPDGFGNIITGKDQYLPIDGAIVELLNTDSAVINTYTTDNYHNGLYFFFNVTPGNYIVRVTKDRYDVTVSDVTVGTTPETNIANANFRIALTQSEEEKQQYVDGDLGLLDSLLIQNSLTIRRALSYEQYLFVLALKTDNTPYLYRVNKSGVVVQQFATDACTVNSGRPLGDICLSEDGVLYGCNNETYLDGSSTSIPNLIYQWTKDGTMSILYENYYRGGGYYTTANWLIGDAAETMTCLGTSNNGRIVFTSENVSPTSSKRYQMRWIMLQLQYGDVVGRGVQMPAETISTSVIGAQYKLHTYKQNIVLSGSTMNHYEMTAPAGVDDKSTSLISKRTDLNGILNFNIGSYAGNVSMFVPQPNGVDIYNIEEDFTSTSKQFVEFGNALTTEGFAGAGSFSGDTLWLIQNNHLTVYPSPSSQPTSLSAIGDNRLKKGLQVMENGVMYIIYDNCKFTMQGQLIK